MSPKDLELLALLQADARESTSSLARKLGVARNTVQERIRRLEAAGVIEGYTVKLGNPARRPSITAHVLMAVNPKRAEAVMRDLKSLANIRGAYALSGAFDYLAMVETESTQAMDEVLDRIGRIDGVERTQSSIVLSIKFERS
ncbi:MAG: Lrp/AsnC family transcriptional regulator [Betaproteobacteria bacterium]|nr:Lrp/AsnC family transcriptional regulator [Betaproteobacteria bacterium]